MITLKVLDKFFQALKKLNKHKKYSILHFKSLTVCWWESQPNRGTPKKLDPILESLDHQDSGVMLFDLFRDQKKVLKIYFFKFLTKLCHFTHFWKIFFEHMDSWWSKDSKMGSNFSCGLSSVEILTRSSTLWHSYPRCSKYFWLRKVFQKCKNGIFSSRTNALTTWPFFARGQWFWKAKIHPSKQNLIIFCQNRVNAEGVSRMVFTLQLDLCSTIPKKVLGINYQYSMKKYFSIIAASVSIA